MNRDNLYHEIIYERKGNWKNVFLKNNYTYAYWRCASILKDEFLFKNVRMKRSIIQNKEFIL